MTLFKFDHFVHVVDRPETAKEVVQSLGLHAVDGGKHEKHGTYNALSYFGLSYIELIGIFDKQLLEKNADDHHSLRATMVRSNYQIGGARIALRSRDLNKDAERFKKLGLEVIGPTPLSRKRPDGSVVSWKLLFVGKKDVYPELPFFIEWDESDDERYRDLQARGTIAEHPLGDVTLQAVGIATKNIDTVVANWSHYLQLEIGEVFIDESLNAKGQRLYLEGGDIIIYEPISEGKVQDVLTTHGEKPFLIEFKNQQVTQDKEVFYVIYRFTK